MNSSNKYLSRDGNVPGTLLAENKTTPAGREADNISIILYINTYFIIDNKYNIKI